MVYTELWHNKTCSSSRFTTWISDTIYERIVGRGAERVRTGKPVNGAERLSFVICKLLSRVIITEMQCADSIDCSHCKKNYNLMYRNL